MGWWTDIAIKHAPSPNHGGAMREHRGCVVHIAAGSYMGTIAWQMNPDSQVSSHFIVSKGGEITQMLDTDTEAWTQREGNGHWLSIENEGYLPSPLTDAQVSANARIFAKSGEVYGHPMVIAYSPEDYGLGHHSMGAETGYDWGHSECPGDSIKAQKPEIVSRAGGDVSASEVWSWDVDPSSGGKYTAAGSLWTTFTRTDYLANTFAPATKNSLASMATDISDIEIALESTRVRLDSMTNSVADLSCTVASQTDQLEDHGRTLGQIKSSLLLVLILVVLIGGGLGAWAVAAG